VTVGKQKLTHAFGVGSVVIDDEDERTFADDGQSLSGKRLV
jgi:hypothetical protein